KLETAKVSLKGDSKLYLNATHRQLELPKFINISDGVASILFSLEYEKDKYEVSSELFVEKLRTNLIDAEELRAGVNFKDGVLKVDHFQLKQNNGAVELIRPVTLVSLPQSH